MCTIHGATIKETQGTRCVIERAYINLRKYTVSQKKPDPSVFANIFAKIKSFKTKFDSLKGYSYLRIMTKFQPS